MAANKKNFIKDDRYIWLDLLKIFACFLVIINHAHGYLTHHLGLNDNTSIFYLIGVIISKIGVPLFIMSTGFLLLNKDIDYKTIIKRISRVLVPLLGLSFVLYVKEVGISNVNIYHFIIDFIKTPYAVHFWYLYMLIGLYLIIPFIKKMVDNFDINDYKMFIFITLILVSILNTFIPNISSYFIKPIFSIIIGYLVSGLYLSKVKIDKKYFITAVLTYIICIIIMFIEMYSYYIMNNSILYDTLNWESIFNVLSSISIFYIFRYLFENKDIKTNFIAKISSTTFGIYLIHYFMIYELYDLEIFRKIFDFNGYMGVMLLELLTFIVSSIIIYLLKKIPIVKKYL